MREIDRMNLGTVQIEKEVIAEIIVSALHDIKGVSLVKRNLFLEILALAGKKIYPGVKMNFVDNGEVNITIKVILPFGVNVHNVSSQIQTLIKNSVDRMIGVTVKEINIIIQGIERGQ